MIDDTLSELAGSAVHPGLDGIEAGVFARIDADRRVARRARGGLVAVIGSATLAGMASAAVPAADRTDTPSGVVAMRLAPSTLLGGG